MKQFFLSLLEDNAGGISAIRMGQLLWTLFLMFFYGRSCLYSDQLPPLPDNILFITLSIYGAKAIQRFGENQNENK